MHQIDTNIFLAGFHKNLFIYFFKWSHSFFGKQDHSCFFPLPHSSAMVVLYYLLLYRWLDGKCAKIRMDQILPVFFRILCILYVLSALNKFLNWSSFQNIILIIHFLFQICAKMDQNQVDYLCNISVCA